MLVLGRILIGGDGERCHTGSEKMSEYDSCQIKNHHSNKKCQEKKATYLMAEKS